MVAAVLSGNRNFEGRIHPQVRASYLASPPLVVAYALAGRVDIDLTTEPLGHDRAGAPVFLSDIWPRERGGPSRHRRGRHAGAVPLDVRQRVRGRRAMAEPARARRATATPGTRRRATSRCRHSSRA